MNKWDLIKEEWLIDTRPYYTSKIVTIENRFKELFLCKIWFNEKKELVLVSVLEGISFKDENLIKNLIRSTGAKVNSYNLIKLI
jgi:hypothetical protein